MNQETKTTIEHNKLLVRTLTNLVQKQDKVTRWKLTDDEEYQEFLCYGSGLSPWRIETERNEPFIISREVAELLLCGLMMVHDTISLSRHLV